ncbi:MAG: hypothetical protein KBA60_04630 [Flavobacteriales bacterium]|nr:hypothetical protein [Flavobacteriales bacterium]MBP7155270.1 hypothetical protein [Flavobacteriales bacterium]HQW40153.1 M1 family aminopeptidase [Flavobacteriales bacterium]
MLRTRSLHFITLVLVGVAAHGQPNPYGCHYFRNAPIIGSSVHDRSEIDGTIARSDTFDILHYDLSLDLSSYGQSLLNGVAEVSFVPLMADQGSIRFDLFQLQVDSVLGSTGPLAFSNDGQYLRVDLGGTVQQGQEYLLTVHYQGIPHRDPEWGGFYFQSNYMYNLGIGISSIPPNFGKVWYPCFDSFVERASYTYHVKTTGNYRLHGQGNFLGEVQLGGDTVVRSFDLPQQIPTHLSAVAVADYVDTNYVHIGANGDMPVRLTAKPANFGNMVARFGNLGAAIDACEFWYGPYAYDRIGYVITTDGALEIPTNVAYPEFMTSQPDDSNQDLYSHELGHHWWGDVVTPHIHNDMWLKEGPAEYTGHLVSEWLGGHEGLERAVKDNQLYVLGQAHINDGGFQALSPMPDEYIYGTHTYYKGASVMHNLRGYMGDIPFREAMSGIQQDLANTTITSTGFKEALEAQSGQDLDPFFDAWVFAPGFAAFEVRDIQVQGTSGPSEVTLLIGQKLRGTSVYHEEVPLDVTFISANGEVNDQEVVASGEQTTVELEVPFVPAMVVLNRYAKLNQARMDAEYEMIPGVSVVNLIPYTDFRVYDTQLVDTTLFRVDHMWSGPDQLVSGPEVAALSNTHYWNVDGLWPEGTVLGARLFYRGGNANEFDHDLFGTNESGAAVLYRATPQDPWALFDHQTLTAGSLTNGNGFITLDSLRKGQYTFGKYNTTVAISDGPDSEMMLTLAPVPASEYLHLLGRFDGQATLWCDIHDMDGRFVRRGTIVVDHRVDHSLDISGLAPGSYMLRIKDAHGAFRTEKRFQVVR